jgi:biopolymer transport protein ExbB
MESILTSPISLLIIACSIVMVGIAIERSLYYGKRKGNPDGTLATVLGKLRSGEVKEALWALENCVHPLGKVGVHILKRERDGRETAEEQLEIALSEQKMLFERNLIVLGTLAAVAPLLGLLGTVYGIMRAFGDMAMTGSAAPSVVASGVAEALITTLLGLMVAIPSLVLYNHFTRRMSVMLTIAENHARSIRSAFTGIKEYDLDAVRSTKDARLATTPETSHVR